DGNRGEITIARAARALAAFEGRRRVTEEDVRRVAPMSLRHRLRRDPLEPSGGDARVRNCVNEIFADSGGGDGAGGVDLSGVDSGGDSRGGRTRSSDGGNSEGERSGDATPEGGELVIPAVEVGLKREAFSGPPDVVRRARQSSPAPARRAGARRSTPAGRGRYSGATAESKGARALS